MYIRTQDEKTVFNFSYFVYISCNELGEVFIGIEGGKGLLLGKYKTVERAKEVLEDIYINLDISSRYDMPIV